MPVAASARRRSPLNYWPGFVDALSTLLLSIVFLLSVFMLAQFFLAREITTQETALERLNRQITELTDLLALERSNRRTVEETVTGLQTTLRASEADSGRLRGMLESGSAADQKAAQRRPRAAGAGARPLPLRLLRPPSADPRQPHRRAYRRRPLRVPVRAVLRARSGDPEAGGDARARPHCGAPRRAREADSARHPMGAAGRRPHRRAPDRDAAVPLELGPVRLARDRRRAVPDPEGHPAAAPRRGGLRRVPAARPVDDRRGLRQEPPHRAQAHGALTGACCERPSLSPSTGWAIGPPSFQDSANERRARLKACGPRIASWRRPRPSTRTITSSR